MEHPLAGDDRDPAVAAVFERVEAGMGRVPNLYRILAAAPPLLEAWVHFAWTLRAEASTERGLRELVILRVAQLTHAEYEWAAHRRYALTFGVTEAQVEALDDWRTGPFSSQERAVLAMADELTTDIALSDSCLAGLHEHFSAEDIVGLVLTAAFYSCVSRTVNGLRVPLEGSA